MKKYIILIPIYNDRESLTKLIENINLELKDLNSEVSIIIVNDASSQQITDTYSNVENINSIEIINMRENRGHARCIASKSEYALSIYPSESILDNLPESSKESFSFPELNLTVCFKVLKLPTELEICA